MATGRPPTNGHRTVTAQLALRGGAGQPAFVTPIRRRRGPGHVHGPMRSRVWIMLSSLLGETGWPTPSPSPRNSARRGPWPPDRAPPHPQPRSQPSPRPFARESDRQAAPRIISPASRWPLDRFTSVVIVVAVRVTVRLASEMKVWQVWKSVTLLRVALPAGSGAPRIGRPRRAQGRRGDGSAAAPPVQGGLLSGGRLCWPLGAATSGPPPLGRHAETCTA